jgi:hypothetical protein
MQISDENKDLKLKIEEEKVTHKKLNDKKKKT